MKNIVGKLPKELKKEYDNKNPFVERDEHESGYTIRAFLKGKDGRQVDICDVHYDSNGEEIHTYYCTPENMHFVIHCLKAVGINL